MNRGVEIDSDVADGPHSVILNQVTNGVAVRMAVLYLLAGGKPELAEAAKGGGGRRRDDAADAAARRPRRSIRRSDSTRSATCSSSTAKIEAIGRASASATPTATARDDRLRRARRLARDSSTCTAICASRAARMSRRSRPARAPRPPADSPRCARCRTPIRSPTIRRRSASSSARRSAPSAARVYPIGAISVGQKGESLAEFGEMVGAGAVAVSDDGKPVVSAQLMRTALEYARTFGIPVADHCEEPTLAARRRDERRASSARGSASRAFPPRPRRSWRSATSSSRGAPAGTSISAT